MKKMADIENGGEDHLAWSGVEYTVKGKKGTTIRLLDAVDGLCRTGQMLSILGPSGAGKSTLLDVLAGRKEKTAGTVSMRAGRGKMSYVEQDDALLGALTIRETFTYSGRLSMPNEPRAVINERVDSLLQGLGLAAVADNLIGTPVQRGISGGQKRRVTIGNGLVSFPRVLFLDEPTSGLDSATAFEVLSSIRNLARAQNLIVVATIHSPNWEIFSLFDTTILLARGKVIYSGSVLQVGPYFERQGYPVPLHTNPADHMLKLVSTSFGSVPASGDDDKVEKLASLYAAETACSHSPDTHLTEKCLEMERSRAPSDLVMQSWTLTSRNFLNYRRNLLAYGVRMGMYLGMGVLVATVWVNMAQDDRHINDRLSVHFFSVAFLGFMSVAGIPSFLEERLVLFRERRNGLYTPLPFVVANTMATIPFLFVCSLVYAVLIYWSVGLHGDASYFFRFLAFLFLGVYAAETQSLLIAAILPIFVAALAVAAFANGFWMAVQGYFMRNLPDFWYYWAHFIDYQTFAFQILVKTDVVGLVFPCAGSLADQTCSCSIPSRLVTTGAQCAVEGRDIIESLGFGGISTTLYAFIIVIIIAVFRVAFWAVLVLQK